MSDTSSRAACWGDLSYTFLSSQTYGQKNALHWKKSAQIISKYEFIRCWALDQGSKQGPYNSQGALGEAAA